MPLIDRIDNKLKELSRKNLTRNISTQNNNTIVDFSTNDYLGLATSSDLSTSINSPIRIGSSASRVLNKNLFNHSQLENSLADFFGFDSCLIFGSGYLSNTGTLSTLIERQDIVLSDKKIHASLIDGIILSRAKHLRVKHNDIGDFEEKLKAAKRLRKSNSEFFIVTESVFSMDGDISPLRELALLSKHYDATLIVDEAHAIGIYGNIGQGLVRAADIDNSNIVILGTLSKSLGSYGGFVCCNKNFKDYLISKARSFLFSTALPEILIEHGLNNLKLIINNPGLGNKLLENSKYFSEELIKEGALEKNTKSPIIPILIGSEEKALKISNTLQFSGINIPAIRPPTVPPNTSRLRCSVTLNHSLEELKWVAKEISKITR